MPVLSVRDLRKSYGAEAVLRGASLEIEAGQKVALVGRNGCGKSTLLAIVAGGVEADGGTVHLERGRRIGLLTQEFQPADAEASLWAEMESVFADLKKIGSEMEKAAEAMAVQGAGPAAADRFVRLQEEFERRGGYTVESRVEKVLRGLGFTPEIWERPVKVLSGGERTRAALARLLLNAPDVLLLDEPTNHLDLWAVAWLEDFLSDYAGAVLVVSHDRYFLDRVANGIYELSEGTAKFYRGNYTKYREMRALERQNLERAQRLQAAELARKERLVRESAADERSKRQARSIAKRIERTELVRLPQEEGAMRLELGMAERGGRTVLEVEGLSKSYGGQTVVAGAAFRLQAGEKVGIIGPNGAGKTTLLRMVLGLEKPDQGRISLGHNVITGYFAQDEQFDGHGTVFSVMQDAGSGDNFQTRSQLARFLFRGEDVWKKVAELSGGERRRLALARLTISGANFLLLDEPTNHLDLVAIEALEDALRAYQGAVLVVTHDRYFLGRVADRILALLDGRLMSFADYSAFAAWRAREESQAAEEKSREAARRREEQRRAREERLAPIREERKKARTLAALEESLEAKEERRAALLRKMAEPEVAVDFQALRGLSEEVAALEEEICRLYREWEAALGGGRPE